MRGVTRRIRRECAWHSPDRCPWRPPGDIRWQPGTRHPSARRGSGGSSRALSISSGVHPSRASRDVHCQHRPLFPLPWAVAGHPAVRQTWRPISGCAAGSDSTRACGSQPASARKPGSRAAASRAASPARATPPSTWPSTSPACGAGTSARAAPPAAAVTGSPAGWAPGPRPPAAGPDPGAGRHASRKDAHDRECPAPRQARRPRP